MAQRGLRIFQREISVFYVSIGDLTRFRGHFRLFSSFGCAAVTAVSLIGLAVFFPIRRGVDRFLEVVHVSFIGGGDFQYANQLVLLVSMGMCFETASTLPALAVPVVRCLTLGNGLLLVLGEVHLWRRNDRGNNHLATFGGESDRIELPLHISEQFGGTARLRKLVLEVPAGAGIRSVARVCLADEALPTAAIEQRVFDVFIRKVAVELLQNDDLDQHLGRVRGSSTFGL